jgi:hypothetical protein
MGYANHISTACIVLRIRTYSLEYLRQTQPQEKENEARADCACLFGTIYVACEPR